MTNKFALTVRVNGSEYNRLIDASMSLLHFLRDEINLTGTKEGCYDGNCGACTVIVGDKVIVDSCLVLAAEMNNEEITTIEGLSQTGGLTKLQKAFLESAALQCGVCTPGFIVSATQLLKNEPKPSEERIRWWLAGNLCRCTGYVNIVKAVQEAAEESEN